MGSGSTGKATTNSQANSNTSGTGASSWAPNDAVSGLYSGILQNLYSLGNTEVPYYPGQTYVAPSELTQQGVALGQQATPLWQGAAQQAQAGSGYYGQGANMTAQGAGYHGQAGQLQATAAPLFQQGAGMTAQGAGYYGQAAGMQAGAVPSYLQGAGLMGQGSSMLAGSAGAMNPYLGQSAQNYKFLSGAADVANNPYVQGQLRANESSVMDTLQNKMLPQLQSGAVNANAMGSSRLGLAQGQAMGDTARALSEQNASTMLNAYGQGLGAQTSALGQTGAMLQNQTMPGQAVQQAGLGFGQQGQMIGQGAAALGQAGGYLGTGGQQLATAGQQIGQGAASLSQAGGYYGTGGQQLSNAGQQMGQGAALQGQGAGYIQQGAGNLANLGQTVEGYQQKQVDEDINRYNYQYEEPWTRMGNVSNYLTGLFGDTGSSYTSETGTGQTNNVGTNRAQSTSGMFKG